MMVMKQESETNTLYAQIAELLQSARNAVVRVVNQTMVRTYFEIGRIIVEDEQQGLVRAEYGKQTLKELSAKLNKDFGKGFSVDNLQNMRQFYLVYGKYEKVSRISESKAIQQKSSVKLQSPDFKLSWSHYLKLMRIEDNGLRRR